MLKKIKLNPNIIKHYKPKNVYMDSKTEKFLYDCIVEELESVLAQTKMIDRHGKLSTVSMKHVLSLKNYNICI